MQIGYNLFIRIYFSLIWVASFFNKKASLWIQGRRNLLERIALDLDHEADYIWFHCASSGEFEQGRPVIERFRKENPGMKVVLTFFSPSGYEMRKNYPLADHVFYLPTDTPFNARKFVEYVNPRLAVFVKYEYWYNFLNELNRKNIPVVFISAIFRKNQMFFRWWASWFRKRLKRISYFFVQDKNSRELLKQIGVHNVVVSGDTRFDRVHQITSKPESFEKVEKFIQGAVIFMGGSTWPTDENLIVSFINNDKSNLKYIIVPHEIHKSHTTKLLESLNKPAVVYSEYDEDKFIKARVLIVDQMGMLSSLYQYASIAYVGGGFGKGIHNILEAAAFGMPVLFGPNYKKFMEARELVERGGAFPVKNNHEFSVVATQLLGNYQLLRESSSIASNYVNSKTGATDSIVVFLNTLTNPRHFKAGPVNLLSMN